MSERQRSFLFYLFLMVILLFAVTLGYLIFVRDDSFIYIRVIDEERSGLGIRVDGERISQISGSSDFIKFNYSIGRDILVELNRKDFGSGEWVAMGKCSIKKMRRNCVANIMVVDGQLECDNCIEIQ